MKMKQKILAVIWIMILSVVLFTKVLNIDRKLEQNMRQTESCVSFSNNHKNNSRMKIENGQMKSVRRETKLLAKRNISLSEQTIYTFHEEWLHDTQMCSGLGSRLGTIHFQKQYIYTLDGPLTLYTFNPRVDVIARRIKLTRVFEPDLDVLIRYFLEENPDTNFIDIGANIGVRSLQVARTGRSVIAIEALDENVHRLCASIAENKLNEKIAVVHNAISDGHSILNITVSSWGERSGSYIDDPQTRKVKDDQERYRKYKPEKQISSIVLDDLLLLPNFTSKFSNVLMKLDIEGFEHRALARGSKFFDIINVKGIIMEWRWHKGQLSATKLVNQLRGLKFVPVNPNIGRLTVLNFQDYNRWPHDVLWLANNSETTNALKIIPN